MYHDFYGPSQIWVNISHDGGATFGAPQEVLAGPAITPGAVTGTLVAQGYTFCNTVPAQVKIVRPGLPHAGRIYVAWIAADLAQNATGCNISMLQSFHTLWVSYSDDDGVTWTPQQAFDAGVGHDASTPFVGFTLDNQGNPYFGFANKTSTPTRRPAQQNRRLEPSSQTRRVSTTCTWSGRTTVAPRGTAAAAPCRAVPRRPYLASPVKQTGTDFFPAIAAGDPGSVAVSYLHTSEILPTDPFGKADPGGCAGPGPGNGNPPTYPPTCQWYLIASQTRSLTRGPVKADWETARVTKTPMHIGDICNLGIACVAPTSNRNLLDFISETLDPRGCSHIAYADDNTINKLRIANQTSGPCLVKAPLPAVQSAGFEPLPLVGGLALCAIGFGRRRRRPT